MIKKSITYTDYNGTERTEDFYFNLTKMEISEMLVSSEEGLDTYLRRIIDAKEYKDVFEAFNGIIAKAYGIKSEDGRRLAKSKDISDAFFQSPAYEALCDEMFFTGNPDDNATKMAMFIKGMFPAEYQEDMTPQNLKDLTAKILSEKD